MVDILGKMNGRGVYLCYDKNCWDIGISKELVGKKIGSSISSEDAKMLIEFSKSI